MIRGRRFSLKNRIIILIITISIYPILLIGYFGAYNYENLIKDRFIANSQKDMNMISNYIERDVENINEFIISLLADQGFYELTSSKPKDKTNQIENYRFKRDMEDYLRAVIFSNKDFDVAGIVFEKDDQMLYAAQEKGMITSTDFPMAKIKEMVEDNVYTQYYIDDDLEGTNLYIAKRVLHKDTFETIGMLFFRLDPEYFMDLVKEGYKEEAESIYLYTQSGTLISQTGYNQENRIITKNGYYFKQEGVYIEEGDTNTYYIVTKKIKPLNLTVITMITNERLTSDLQKITDMILILCALNIPLYVIIAYILYNDIAKPIKDLTDKMALFEQGKFETMKEPRRNDEIGFLYKAFIRMTQNIRTLIRNVYEKELARKDAEIAALQEQINPHFLYNTLESINWRAQLAGQNDIAQMIQALSKLMDASINRDDEKYVSLEQEIIYMEQYMFLVQMRYDQQIVYHKEIDPLTLEMRIPRLILQPLVENAIKHGIEPIGEGEIFLRTFQNDDKWTLEVEDTGAGMIHPKIQSILRIFETEKASVHEVDERRSSIGLQNVARRLYLIYDGLAEINVKSELGKGTKVTLVLPIKRD